MSAVKSIPQIFPAQLKLAETVVQRYSVVVNEHVTREDINNPDFWNHVAKNLTPGSRVEVTTEDGKYLAEFYVRYATRTHAQMHEILYIEFDKKQAPLPDDAKYEIKWKGPHVKHAIIRKSDNEVIQAFDTKEQAEQALVNLK